MVFHTFGDSHSSAILSGWNIIPNAKCNHISPAFLCYTLGIQKLKKLNIMNYNVKENDTVCFCFGEIDCRNHIHKHITKDKPFQKIIDEIVDNYFIAIDLNIKQFNNLKVCVYNIVPPGKYRPVSSDHPYPYLGTDEDRKKYYLYFNIKLKEKCKEYNYIFFDIYDKCIDQYGFLSNKISKDGCHLNFGGKILLEFYNKNVL
tara:strand:- start:5681 stop:6286 length:606 start_codon:yes stop_codon:yes gene_type:complete